MYTKLINSLQMI